MGARSRRTFLRGAAALCAAGGAGVPVRAEPASLRLGYGGAAEEPFWLLLAQPSLGKNYGKAFTLDATRFQGSDKRAQAFEAGAIDLALSGANGVLFAAAEGVNAKIIASISQESARGFSTSYYAKAQSGIRSVPDLKGKTVGLNGFSTSGHLWLWAALQKHGLSDSDVTIAPVPFPAMEEALIAGKIDAGEFPQPFAALLEKDAAVNKIFVPNTACLSMKSSMFSPPRTSFSNAMQPRYARCLRIFARPCSSICKIHARRGSS
jgi:ABC-type nitrate/sulfonate/bicarbonate transport system substrate-binding protein